MATNIKFPSPTCLMRGYCTHIIQKEYTISRRYMRQADCHLLVSIEKNYLNPLLIRDTPRRKRILRITGKKADTK